MRFKESGDFNLYGEQKSKLTKNKAVELGSVESPDKADEPIARIPNCTIFSSIA